ncbi:MAG: efflux RND transporter permease subunit [Nostoc sp.]|uniref:efflux RND transporter permease subunit n=1 Tax=Nostoc sp. TaxID=1180 RepID=UPI002FFC8AD5
MILDTNKPHKQVKMKDPVVANQLINSQLDAVVKSEVATADFKSRLIANSICSTGGKGKGENYFLCSTYVRSLLMSCLVAIGLLTASCGSSPKESADAESQSPGNKEGSRVTPVDVVIARTELLEKQLEYIGNTTPFRIVSLRSQVEGRLLALNLDVGDTVKLGQNVGQLDDAILSTGLKQAEAELAALKSEVARANNQVSNARADVEKARLEVLQAQADSERQQRLFKAGAIAEVNEVLKDVDLPDGVSIVPSSAQETNQQLQDALKTLGALATFLIFVVMAVQYNSLIDPLVILFTIPLALAGGIFGLYITKTAIGATVIVGVVLLVGIVVNAGILMVELANQIRDEEGCSRQIAIVKAAPQRLRPIIMTTVTTILGLFPLALGIGEGSEFLQPLGIVVFFGMAISTMLTLFIIPCFYILLHDLLGGNWAKPVFIRLRRFTKKLI